jgi:hypothetical protein
MKMNCAVVAMLISLVFVSQASAVLRPLFPIKPSAPFNGELIVIGDELVLRSAKKPEIHHPFRHTRQCLDTSYRQLYSRHSLAAGL